MWTMDNTEGFSQVELNAANQIAERIKQDHDGIDETNINDALTNAHVAGISETDWEAAARKHLGH